MNVCFPLLRPSTNDIFCCRYATDNGDPAARQELTETQITRRKVFLTILLIVEAVEQESGPFDIILAVAVCFLARGTLLCPALPCPALPHC
jgi:hypothetical protein